MKPKSINNSAQSGFTLIELLVVVTIMMLLVGALLIDFNRQRGVRGIQIAQNETATNLRKVQAYSLSSRDLPDGSGAKYYLMEIDPSQVHPIRIGAVDDDYQYYQPELESINLPPRVSIESMTLDGVPVNCLQLIFTVPYGTMYATNICGNSIAATLENPYEVAQLSQDMVNINLAAENIENFFRTLQINPFTGQVSGI